MINKLFLIFICVFPINLQCRPFAKDKDFWEALSDKIIKDSENKIILDNLAKNIIFFVGDGMSISTIVAARIYKAQKKNSPDLENSNLIWERFPHSCLIKTHNAQHQVPDAASSATAFLCGIKSNQGSIGIKPSFNNCSSLGNVECLLNWAQKEGKATGFVTTTKVTDATTAGLYAKVPDRQWESDETVSFESNCKDIARQLIEDAPGRDIQVILGGGRQHFFPTPWTDPRDGTPYLRQDHKNLVKDWTLDKINRRLAFKYVTNLQEFNDVNSENVDYLLGLFSPSHMNYEVERDVTEEGEPSLAEMTVKAIQILQRNPQGFFLFVEGGRIDHAHHENKARYALEETIALEEAVQQAFQQEQMEETLMIVTSDHSQVMTINGYAKRGNSILGLAGISDIDQMPYTSLMYTNGPAYRNYVDGSRRNLTEALTNDLGYQQMAMIPMSKETHGGEDVALYAIGPKSYLFHGVQDQTYIPYALSYAACIGKNKDHCEDVTNPIS